MKSKRDWFELGYVFDFETRCLKNYKTGEIADVQLYNWLFDEVCSFSYEGDLDKYLHRCVTKERKWFFFTKEYYDFPEINYSGVDTQDYVYYVNGKNRGFCRVDDEFIFDENTLWCNMEEYYELTEKWYDLDDDDMNWLNVYYDTFEHLQKISDLVRGYRNISWLER
jgi:hypothetical protein